MQPVFLIRLTSRLDSPERSPYLSGMPHKPSKVPAFIAPQIPVLSTEPPAGSGWIHEIKHDGFRTLIRIAGKDARAFTRSGLDWSDKYQRVIEACHKLRCRSALIDGEIIVQDERGISDFAALRAAIDREPHRLVLFAFDLLFIDGTDLRRLPLMERRAKLQQLIPVDTHLPMQFSDHYDGDGAELFQQACAMGLEGIVSKRVLSPYKSGPSKFWLKTKNVVESELILLGTDYDNEGKPIAYLGRDDNGQLRFAGTAFLTLSGEPRNELQARIEKLSTNKAALKLPKVRTPQWVKPELWVRIRHLQGGDTLRHASVRGILEP
jgi:bifunctional non-homologous end joining protein LigD